MPEWNSHNIPIIGDGNAFGVYAIRNVVTECEYIGDTWGPCWKRWRAHLAALKNGYHHCHRLQGAWDGYGPEAFELIVLEACATNDEVYGREAYWVDVRHGSDTRRLYNSIGVRRKMQVGNDIIVLRVPDTDELDHAYDTAAAHDAGSA